jgi:SAM-dependent methyltransferase
MRDRLRWLERWLHLRLLGRHPYNTVLNYNWVNVRPMVRTLRALAPLVRGRVVDVGAGRSPYYDLFSAGVRSYVAVDHPASLPVEEDRPIARVAGIVEALPLRDGAADTLLSTQVLSQSIDPSLGLREVSRVLRPGGHAILSAPHSSPLHAEPYDLYRFTPEGLRRLGEEAGLQVVGLESQGQIFSGFALALAMNLVLTPVSPGRPMEVRPRRQLLFAPLIGLVNVLAYLLDGVLPFNRSPVNLIVILRKR